jgi:hypothetical protein
MCLIPYPHRVIMAEELALCWNGTSHEGRNPLACTWLAVGLWVACWWPSARSALAWPEYFSACTECRQAGPLAWKGWNIRWASTFGLRVRRPNYPENWSKLLIMRGMPFSFSVVSLRGTGVSTENVEEAGPWSANQVQFLIQSRLNSAATDSFMSEVVISLWANLWGSRGVSPWAACGLAER